MEQDKYIGQILRLTRLLNPELANPTNAFVDSGNHCAFGGSYSVTPITNRRSVFANKLEKAVQTIRHGVGVSNPSVSSSSSSGAGPLPPNSLNAFTNNGHHFNLAHSKKNRFPAFFFPFYFLLLL